MAVSSLLAGHGRGRLTRCAMRLLRAVRSCRLSGRSKAGILGDRGHRFTALVSTGNPCRAAKWPLETGFLR